MRCKEIIAILNKLNPDAIFAEGFDSALIGYTQNNRPNVAVYDLEKCISVLVDSGMPVEHAISYLGDSISSYSGLNDPVFVSL